MTTPPQQPPFDVEQQQPYPESLLNYCAPHAKIYFNVLLDEDKSFNYFQQY